MIGRLVVNCRDVRSKSLALDKYPLIISFLIVWIKHYRRIVLLLLGDTS